MIPHPHITPNLLAVAAGPEPEPDDRPWYHLSRRRHWLALAIAVSLLIHLAIMLVVFYEPVRELPDSRAASPAEWMVEVEPDQKSGAAEARGTPDGSIAKPPQPAPQQAAPPPAPQPPSKTEQKQPSEAQPAPSPPVPPPTPNSESAASEQSLPQPTPQLPPPAVKPPSQPQQQQSATTAPPKPVIPLSPIFGASPFQQKTPAPPQTEAAPPQGQDHGLNIAMGKAERITGDPPRRNANDESFDMQVEGAQVGSDWMQQVRAFWMKHRFYPQEAIANYDQGTVVVRFKVDRHGVVSDFHQLESSGSRHLDLAARSVFAEAQLPPFPYNTPENEATLTLRITYSIIFFEGGGGGGRRR